ncbi:hypothetical protein WJX73_007240 [Symbiochloris irregularis]|uniref:Eukaryotic translation initiation factor 3 30 kDa subunit n=1 Tax=Symbiochloris irregularis TaxID=706552 RepID=A0AAW1PFL9_9CHLO
MSADKESWEDDWDADDFQPQGLGTVGQTALAKASEPDASKFAGEDEEDEKPAWEKGVPKTQQKKAPARPAYEDRGAVSQEDQPLDDPIAEKLRKQKLVEDADLRSAEELFGGSAISLDSFAPKSAKDFEQFGKSIVQKYVAAHTNNSNYKSLLKALVKEALASSDVQQVKDVEACLAGIRSEKIKEEKAKLAAAKVAGKKKSLNVGAGGGTAGLDDYKYDQALDDEDDFM